MKLVEIAKYRLISQQLEHTAFNDAPAITAWFGAVQGQEYAQAKWGLALRLGGLKDSVIERDFMEGKLLRTHLLRPTWHLVAAQDIKWLLRLSAPRVNAANKFMYRKMELDSAIFKTCNDVMTKILSGNNHKTREEVNLEFKKHKIVAEGHRLSYIMMQAELEGIICSGAKSGNQFTYALLDERIKNTDQLEPADPLAELSKRYFLSRGPATVYDFSTWSGLTLTECRKGIESIQKTLEKFTFESGEYYFSPGLSLKKSSGKIYLLPIYDEFIMGYKKRDAIFHYKNSLGRQYLRGMTI